MGSPCLKGCSPQLLPAPYLEGRSCPDPSPAAMSKASQNGLFGGLCKSLPWRIASQQCTRTPQTSVERPFLPICVHSCIPTVVRNGATVYTSAPKRRREAVFANLCTLLRPHGRSRDRAGPRVPRHRRLHGPRATQVFGPEARPTGAVNATTSTHTNSRSIPKCGSHHIFYLYNVIKITFWKGWNGQRRSKELGCLADVAPSQAAHPKRCSSGGQDMGSQGVWQSPLPKLRLPQPRGDRPGHTE